MSFSNGLGELGLGEMGGHRKKHVCVILEMCARMLSSLPRWCYLGLYSAVAFALLDVNLLSLDPFRKMFKRQKHHFEVQIAAKYFTDVELSRMS